MIRRPMAAALALAIALVVAGSALPAPTAGHAGIGLERFMYALGQVESGGSYTARNSSTGAYGRYQIIPSTWRAWAKEVLGNAYAPMTPANQDTVAAYKLHQAYHRIGSWPPVAYWWLTGRINTNRATWSSFARSYVDKIMRIYYGTTDTVSVSSVSSSSTVYYQESYRYIRWSGLWATGARSGYSGGSAKYSDQAGAYVEFRFTGRAVTWYGLRASTSGVAKVYVDGVYARTIDTASPWQPSAPLFSKGWASSGVHTLTIKVMGTPGRPSVVVDYFKVVK